MIDAINDGPNPDYSPRDDAIDAIAEHLREDDTAYRDGDESERQAERIMQAIEHRGLTVARQGATEAQEHG